MTKPRNNKDNDTIIDKLFDDANVVSTHDVAVAYDLSENDVRGYAEDLEVTRIGASFAWTQPDVEALEEELDAPDPDDGEDEDTDEDDDGEED